MFHVLFQSQIAVATDFVEETWSRNLINVLTTPVTEVEYIAGTAAFGMVKVLLALTTLSLTAFGFFGFHLSTIGWSIIPIAAVLVIVGWGVGIANIGVVLRFGQGAEVITWGSRGSCRPHRTAPRPGAATSSWHRPACSTRSLRCPARCSRSPGCCRARMRSPRCARCWTAMLPLGEIRTGLIGATVLVVLCFAFSARMLRVFRNCGLVTRFS